MERRHPVDRLLRREPRRCPRTQLYHRGLDGDDHLVVAQRADAFLRHLSADRVTLARIGHEEVAHDDVCPSPYRLPADTRPPPDKIESRWPGPFWVAVATVASSVAGINLALHGLLDSVASPMAWAAPFSEKKWEMVRVPPTHGDKWVLSMLDHWTFGIEVGLVAAAVFVLLWRLRRRRRTLAPS